MDQPLANFHQSNSRCIFSDNANPIYGRHPSAARAILTKLVGGAFHFWLVDKMNKKSVGGETYRSAARGL